MAHTTKHAVYQPFRNGARVLVARPGDRISDAQAAAWGLTDEPSEAGPAADKEAVVAPDKTGSDEPTETPEELTEEPSEDEATTDELPSLSGLKKAELQELAKDRGLDTTGTNSELRERLEATRDDS